MINFMVISFMTIACVALCMVSWLTWRAIRRDQDEELQRMRNINNLGPNN